MVYRDEVRGTPSRTVGTLFSADGREFVIADLDMSKLPQVAELHCRAFPKSLFAALGRRVVLRYYEWQLTGPHDVQALGAFRGQRLAGFCIGGVFHGAFSGFLRKNWAFLLRHFITHPWIMANPEFRDRLRLHVQVMLNRQARVAVGRDPAQKKAERSFGILAIAVDPAMQGRGVGKALMNEAEAHARKSGFAQMHLTVNPANLRAIRFYERIGWTRVDPSATCVNSMRKRL